MFIFWTLISISHIVYILSHDDDPIDIGKAMRMTNQKTGQMRYVLLSAVILMAGCATPEKPDPLECFNRGMHHVHKGLDKAVVKPVASIYDAVLPVILKNRVRNFFDNVMQLPAIVNDLLQGQGQWAKADAARFIINSTLGIGGLFDWASKAGLERHKQDFGRTLHAWGYQNSTYLFIPLLGPSTARDVVGRVATFYMTPYPYLKSVRLRNGLLITNYISERADLLKTEKIIDTAAVDEYIFIRDAYLQSRATDEAGPESEAAFGQENGIPQQGGSPQGKGALDNLQGPPE